ncbi:MAG TPA: T9SS type A sorting domain-containing protein [Bacteroidetes bacterium]|nr:T9SS type A sorting domain-containing protein [Bacteroidota bacterium]
MGLIENFIDNGRIWLFKVNSEGCFGEDNCDEIQRTDVLEIEKDYQPLAVYPNPTKEMIKVTLPENNNWQRWSIYDLNGKLLKNGSINNSFDFTISGLKELGSGMYFLKVYDGQDRVGIGKFVVE